MMWKFACIVVIFSLFVYCENRTPSLSSSKSVESENIKNVDCFDWYQKGYNKSGVYTIWLMNKLTMNKSLEVYCDMDTDGGGWTVIQRRGDYGRPKDFFRKTWNSYRNGFGNVTEDFWLGNDNIFALTNQKLYSIRFDLQNMNMKKSYAKYNEFWIEDERRKYTLHIHHYSGNAGDGMNGRNNMKFTTIDQDNDQYENSNCAITCDGAWWYRSCCLVNLNGLYNEKRRRGLEWKHEKLYWTEMKIKP